MGRELQQVIAFFIILLPAIIFVAIIAALCKLCSVVFQAIAKRGSRRQDINVYSRIISKFMMHSV